MPTVSVSKLLTGSAEQAGQTFAGTFSHREQSVYFYEVDIIEPHDDSRADTWAKAKGLAVFADLHGMDFGQLIIARKKDGQFQMADMNQKVTRDRARKMQSQNDLESLFR
jgi:hypothetical protein